MTAVPNRPALRYFGGKWRLATWIIQHLPPHTCYAEPFAGALSVLIRKPPSSVEVANDADADVVAFFRVLRDRPEDLKQAILNTPVSRLEFERAGCPVEGNEPDRDLEQARRLYVRCWQSRGRPALGRSAWSYRRELAGTDRIACFYDVQNLDAVAARLRRVQWEHSDWREILPRFDAPGTCWMIDPPYLLETRPAGRAYRLEMEREDHEDLLQAVMQLRGMVVLCGYDSPLYREHLVGWRRSEKTTRADKGRLRTEVLWLNPAAAAGLHAGQSLQRPALAPAILDRPATRAGARLVIPVPVPDPALAGDIEERAERSPTLGAVGAGAGGFSVSPSSPQESGSLGTAFVHTSTIAEQNVR